MKKAFKALREYFREESMTELLIKLICALCISTMLIFIIMGCSQKTSICENADKTEHKRICNTYNNNEDDVNPTTTSHITTGQQGIGNY